MVAVIGRTKSAQTRQSRYCGYREAADRSAAKKGIEVSITGRALRSTIDDKGILTISLENVSVEAPGDDEIIVRVEATPINPSDLGLLLGPADTSTAEAGTTGGQPSLFIKVPENRIEGIRNRMGQALPVGAEAAGTVVAAGKNAKSLEGKLVGIWGGSMYADYRKLAAKDCVLLPDGAKAADGASMFVNPLTSQCFVETARREGHRAIINTAAASNLGQMLQKICLADGIPLINIVRSPEQVAILKNIGAKYVLNSKDANFLEQLADAASETGATIAFDALGGGTFGGQIMQAMERAAVKAMKVYSRYGSDTYKQLYIYGSLDPSPVVLDRRTYGFQWGVAGWVLTPFMRKFGEETVAGMRKRVVDELMTTFSSTYTRGIGLAEALKPEVVRAYERKATGEKYFINPTLD